jgi:hypothetical protein
MTHELCKISQHIMSDKDFFSSIDLLEALIEHNAPKVNEGRKGGVLESQQPGNNNYTPAFFHPEKAQNSNTNTPVVYEHSIC